LLVFAALLVSLPLRAAPTTESIELAHHRFTVEIARTDPERERGLMYRTHMPADHGMLFVFSDAQLRYFWMKNTLIPLDIIFFDAHKRLVNISANTPPCKPLNAQPTQAPRRPVRTGAQRRHGGETRPQTRRAIYGPLTAGLWPAVRRASA